MVFDGEAGEPGIAVFPPPTMSVSVSCLGPVRINPQKGESRASCNDENSKAPLPKIPNKTFSEGPEKQDF